MILIGISILIKSVRKVYRIGWDGRSMDFEVRQTWAGKLALLLASFGQTT